MPDSSERQSEELSATIPPATVAPSGQPKEPIVPEEPWFPFLANEESYSTYEYSGQREGNSRETEDYTATEYGLHFHLNSRPFDGTERTQSATDSPPQTEEREARPAGFWHEAKALGRDVVFAAVTAILIVWFVVQPVKVEGTSMVPQLENGERIFVNKFIYSVDIIHRGDVVVFWYPLNPSQSFIKRVVGLPGETIRIENGRVYINNEAYTEPYLSPEHTKSTSYLPPTTVSEHHYFVMGDNRDASNDSRHWGLVPEKYIYGKAMFRYWPPASFGIIDAPMPGGDQEIAPRRGSRD